MFSWRVAGDKATSLPVAFWAPSIIFLCSGNFLPSGTATRHLSAGPHSLVMVLVVPITQDSPLEST